MCGLSPLTRCLGVGVAAGGAEEWGRAHAASDVNASRTLALPQLMVDEPFLQTTVSMRPTGHEVGVSRLVSVVDDLEARRS